MLKTLDLFSGCNCRKANTYVFAERLIRNASPFAPAPPFGQSLTASTGRLFSQLAKI